jgi:hypothetical protein
MSINLTILTMLEWCESKKTALPAKKCLKRWLVHFCGMCCFVGCVSLSLCGGRENKINFLASHQPIHGHQSNQSVFVYFSSRINMSWFCALAANGLSMGRLAI